MTEVKTQYVLEVSIFDPEENFGIAKEYFKTTDKIEIIKKAQNTECDILGLKFNVPTIDKIANAAMMLKILLPYITKPLMINGCGNETIDKELLPALIKVLDRECTIAFATENTYKEITPSVIKGKHKLVLRTPIDINLCKELNILTSDLGLPLDKIIIDTDIGGLGYGLDYGYSTIEKIKLENDTYLNMPIISFVAEESLKVKETKSENFTASWGELSQRAKMFELAAVSAVKAAGADILVLYYPENIKTMKGLE